MWLIFEGRVDACNAETKTCPDNIACFPFLIRDKTEFVLAAINKTITLSAFKLMTSEYKQQPFPLP